MDSNTREQVTRKPRVACACRKTLVEDYFRFLNHGTPFAQFRRNVVIFLLQRSFLLCALATGLFVDRDCTFSHYSKTPFFSVGGGGGGGGGIHLLLALSNLTIDHASLSKRSTVSTAHRDTSNIWALITVRFSHILHRICCLLILSPSCFAVLFWGGGEV